MSRTDLLNLIDDIRARIANGDSLEGNVRYLLASRDAERPFDVDAMYRVGNRAGQGGAILIGCDSCHPAPREVIHCTGCGDTTGPFERIADGHRCETCGTMTDGGPR
ncbi:hypothetical protein [Streptomyces syringium]|uniref:hypothetical protein n=1 Tax=Streptomyces syringium TaxID=76729 RepID=UPI0037CD129F